MKKILITGITGFIGSELAHALIKGKEFEVVGLVRTSSNRDHLQPIADIIDEISIFRANLTDYSAIRSIVRSFKPQYILHLGAQTAVRESFEMPNEFSETNYLGTINLIHAALELYEFKKFIFASTMEVYGWQKEKKPFKETIKLNPASPYAVSKAAIEYYLQMARHAYRFPYLIARCCNTYGRKYNSGFIVEYIITSMLAKKPIYIGTPRAVRDLMYIDDHVKAYLTLIRSSLIGEVFNFSPTNGINMLALARKIQKKLNYKGKIIQHFPPDYPNRPVVEPYLSLDSAKAKKLLHWAPHYSLEKGLNRTIAYWKKRKVV